MEELVKTLKVRVKTEVLTTRKKERLRSNGERYKDNRKVCENYTPQQLY